MEQKSKLMAFGALASAGVFASVMLAGPPAPPRVSVHEVTPPAPPWSATCA